VREVLGRRRLPTFLSPAELSLYEALPTAARKRDFFAGRLAAKLALTHDLLPARLPPAWPRLVSIVPGRLGEPICDALGPRFRGALSLAHSGGWGIAAVALRPRLRVGVDLETNRLVRAPFRRHVLRASERRWLDRMSGRMKRHWSLACWVLKEATLKALGVGLRVSPTDVVIRKPPTGRSGSIALAGAARRRWPLVKPSRIKSLIVRSRDVTYAVVAIDGPTRPKRASHLP
jgi:phosphopantetheinyl transferase